MEMRQEGDQKCRREENEREEKSGKARQEERGFVGEEVVGEYRGKEFDKI